ncbi:hypothetical protein EDF70_11811 [Neorhizobium sp. JUb45]|nr:hypothetical protein EDF70_11811 [Neorhizobium sp. JUb45]
MRTLLSADALRAARTLAGLSQREAANGALMTQKALWLAEGENPLGNSTNAKLKMFYENLGIEFLGTVDLATGQTAGLGVRWRSPSQLPALSPMPSDFHTERTGVAFGPARAILNKNQSEIADRSGVPQRKIGLMETGGSVDQASSLRLRSYYEREGIAFLGWGDVTSGLFYGVGIKWAETPLSGPDRAEP